MLSFKFISLRRPRLAGLPAAAFAVCAACAAVLLVSGCGSGGSKSTVAAPLAPVTAVTSRNTGRAVVTVLWPTSSAASSTTAQTRLIPQATALVHLDVLRTVGAATTVVGSGEAVRQAGVQTATIEIDNLPIDTLTVVATAYPGTDPAHPGVPVAQGRVPVTTQDGQIVAFSLTLNSTIDHIDVTPVNPTIVPGTQFALTATAWNGPDETTASVVLLSPNQLQWVSNHPEWATVSPAGVVTTIAKGNPTIRVTDTETGKSATTVILIHIIVTVSPAATNLSVTDSTTLTAVVEGTTDQAVTWSVVESAGGSVSQTGVYTAPALPGIYHITATSQADPTQSATITLTVQAVDATGTVQ